MSEPPGRYALVIGESLVDVVTHPEGATVEHPGGSGANTAVALARLGRPAELLTAFAHDARGAAIAAHLAASGVVLAGDPAVIQRTSIATATIGVEGAATYQFDVQWQIKPPSDLSPAIVHVSSLATLLMPGAANVLGLLHRLRNSTTISYDINLRSPITGVGNSVVDLVEMTVRLSDIVKASDEDFCWPWDPDRLS